MDGPLTTSIESTKGESAMAKPRQRERKYWQWLRMQGRQHELWLAVDDWPDKFGLPTASIAAQPPRRTESRVPLREKVKNFSHFLVTVAAWRYARFELEKSPHHLRRRRGRRIQK